MDKIDKDTTHETKEIDWADFVMLQMYVTELHNKINELERTIGNMRGVDNKKNK